MLACGTVLFPIVGIGAMAVIPMSDFCNGIPITGSDTSTFLKTFTTTGDIMEVNRSVMSIMTDCFTKPDGVLWNVVDLDRPLLLNRLQRYDLSKKIDPRLFELALNTEKRDLTSTCKTSFNSYLTHFIHRRGIISCVVRNPVLVKSCKIARLPDEESEYVRVLDVPCVLVCEQHPSQTTSTAFRA